MPRMILIIAGVVLLALSLALAAGSGGRPQAIPITTADRSTNWSVSNALSPCTLNKAVGSPTSYYSGFTNGTAVVTYYDPALCGGTTYPFQINSLSFSLFTYSGAVWPAKIDVVIYDLAVPGSPCSGPGQEHCRISATCAQTAFEYPAVGTVTLATPCCVNGPFYAGLQYTDPTPGVMPPSIIFDNTAAVTCDNWMLTPAGGWLEWYTVWTQPVPGYPLFLVNGETNSTACLPPCDWAIGQPHKMHFPQLPDENGWDVNATAPMTLADDWQCSETGWIKDLHFWGSWMHGVTGQIQSFHISVHEDIPAQPPLIPYSRPGNLLWQRDITKFTQRLIDGQSPEGWYDPSTGQFTAPDHSQYFKYDICLDSVDWFFQTRGKIYWVDISATVVNTPIPTVWGWKTSTEHFNDDAVWDGSVINPPTCVAPDNGTGTADLPAQCPFIAPSGPMQIIDGLPPGTTIDCAPTLSNFFNITRSPGGSLGGENEQFMGQLHWTMAGTGVLAGFSKTVDLQPQMQVDQGPRVPSTSPQSMPSAFIGLQGQLPPGDPDFDLLRITAGNNFGLPSPGHTTLTQIGTNWGVDCYFDLTYRIDFIGHPGGPMGGMSGSTTGTIRMQQGSSTGTGPNWIDLHYPPDFIRSMDMSFVVTGGYTCDCTPGDANHDGLINVGDAVYMINFVFKGGTAPKPYNKCSGDANCDCAVNVADAVYLINYVFKHGPAPCDCQTWLTKCGPPLRN